MSDEKYHYVAAPPDQWDKLKPLARAMRHESTPAEDVLWQAIRSRKVGGAKFRRQHAIAGFVVDFACVEKLLIIEVDGSIHEEPDQKALDAQRQTALELLGFRVIRFTNEAVFERMDQVREAICAVLTSPPQPPSPKARGESERPRSPLSLGEGPGVRFLKGRG